MRSVKKYSLILLPIVLVSIWAVLRISYLGYHRYDLPVSRDSSKILLANLESILDEAQKTLDLAPTLEKRAFMNYSVGLTDDNFLLVCYERTGACLIEYQSAGGPQIVTAKRWPDNYYTDLVRIKKSSIVPLLCDGSLVEVVSQNDVLYRSASPEYGISPNDFKITELLNRIGIIRDRYGFFKLLFGTM